MSNHSAMTDFCENELRVRFGRDKGVFKFIWRIQQNDNSHVREFYRGDEIFVVKTNKDDKKITKTYKDE